MEKTEPIGRNSLKHVAVLIFLYSTAHIFLFFSKVVMWDGRLWAMLLKQKHYDVLFGYFEQARLLHIPLVYRLVDVMGDPIFYSNVLQFFSWLIAGLCVYFILRDFLKADDAFFVAALYLLLPIFIVRFELTVLPYSLSNMFFFLAVSMHLLSEKTPQRALAVSGRYISILFFLPAFLTNSFLFFYGGFLLLLLARDFSEKRKGESVEDQSFFRFTLYALRFIAKWVIKRPLLVFLPVLFYVAEKLFLGAPYGAYKEYNLFVFLYPGASIQRIIFLLADRIWQSIVYGFFWPMVASISILQRKFFAVLFMGVGIILYFLLRKYIFWKQDKSNPSLGVHQESYVNPHTLTAGRDTLQQGENEQVGTKSAWYSQQGVGVKYFFAGCVLFILGFIPYVLVGESPNPYGHGFDMRHGLLLPLGSALIILAFMRIFLSIQWRLSATAGIFALFITFNIFNYYSIDMDSYKQLGIIESLRSKFESKELAPNAIVVFNDKLPLYNWRGRELEDFEYTAYLYEASGSERALGTFLRNDLSFTFTFKERKDNLSDEMLADRIVYADIASSSFQEPTFMNWLKLKKADLFGSQTEFTNLIKDLLAINVVVPSRWQSWSVERR